jgi:peroxiredoxin
MALARIGIRTKEEENSGASLSGNERDHLFLNRRGAEFADISGISGLDDPADGRAFGLIDYDRDGWQDLALVNSNAPWLELFRNRIGCHPATRARGGGFIAVRFVGGNRAPYPTLKWSARDGVGARVTVDLGDLRLVREAKAGEGFASENSATLLIGIGDRKSAASVGVRWPSGKTQTTRAVAAGTLLTVYENPAQAPGGLAFVTRPYVRARGDVCADPGAKAASGRPRLALAAGLEVAPAAAAPDTVESAPAAAPQVAAAAPVAPRLRLFTTMATWCVACRGEISRLNDLRAAFTAEDLGMYGVPIDPTEGSDKIEAWGAELKPPYRLLAGAPPEQVAALRDLLIDRLKFDAVPATVVTDAAGNVLHTQWGPPSISRLKGLLATSLATNQ